MSNFTLTTESAVERIRLRNASLGTYVTTRLPEALQQSVARKAEAPRSSLHGVPYSLKDEFDTRGLRTTGGSYRHRDRIPSESCTIHEVFEDAGAILVGKSNLSDMGLPPEACSYVGGAARNPYDLSRTAGGSSGGSAAAVADGMAAFEWGADIGGSIRLPAAFCGVLGLRLSSETWPIPATGFFPRVPTGLSWMCGHGPFTRTVPQMREVLAIAAPRARTGTAATFALRGACLHVPSNLGKWPSFVADVTPHLRAAIETDVSVASDGRRTRSQHELPSSARLREVYGAVWASHFEDLLASDPSITLGEGVRAALSSIVFRGRLGDRRFYPSAGELLALIAVGRYTIFRDRARALRDAHDVRARFAELWARGVLVVAPVCAFPAPRVGRSNYNLDLLSCTVAGNLADATGLSIPFGSFDDGLPRAVQLLGPPGCESLLLDLAERLEASRDRDPQLRWRPPPV